MFLADSSLDIPVQRNLINLYQIHESFLLSYLADLGIDYVSYLDIEASDGEFVLYIISCSLVAPYYSDDRSKDVILIDIKSIQQTFVVVFGYFLAHHHSLPYQLIHHYNINTHNIHNSFSKTVNNLKKSWLYFGLKGFCWCLLYLYGMLW